MRRSGRIYAFWFFDNAWFAHGFLSAPLDLSLEGWANALSNSFLHHRIAWAWSPFRLPSTFSHATASFSKSPASLLTTRFNRFVFIIQAVADLGSLGLGCEFGHIWQFLSAFRAHIVSKLIASVRVACGAEIVGERLYRSATLGTLFAFVV